MCPGKGLGPTIDISFFNTLINCGNSSKLVFLKNLPKNVTLKFSSFKVAFFIVLNLKIIKILPK